MRSLSKITWVHGAGLYRECPCVGVIWVYSWKYYECSESVNYLWFCDLSMYT